jgi:hypothetical protein
MKKLILMTIIGGVFLSTSAFAERIRYYNNATNSCGYTDSTNVKGAKEAIAADAPCSDPTPEITQTDGKGSAFSGSKLPSRGLKIKKRSRSLIGQ